jgi:uncharacterized protein
LDLERLKQTLGLQPHPEEGGFFVETYRSTLQAPADTLIESHSGSRNFSTAIYYLLTPQTISAMHRVRSDEVFHFYLGDPVEQLQLFPNGSGQIVTLGSDILNGQRPQVVVPAGVWQGAHLKPGGEFALFGCTVSPGFEYEDYQHGNLEQLNDEFPQFRELLSVLTR